MAGLSFEWRKRRSRKKEKVMGRRRRSSGGNGREVRRKVSELRRLVPGGERLVAEKLFSTTASYILQLRMQVGLLRALYSRLHYLP
ncbi:hypothetical protein HPP92_017321 [Vanilla planifolia]|uniref:Uncharacterized protein n=1 Tax=Vanilla planifolia TaxID=51239 RepID=A0A835UT05_VANPL|nr:hypothetical protein HPP92_017321 [Vanilla planifolia]